MNAKPFALIVACLCPPLLAAEPSEADPISSYLVNIDGGSVSAAGIINLDKSAVRTIQSAQDIALALKPFGSDDAKAGIGVSFTPARTELVPVSKKAYYDSVATRLLSNLTLSYAQDEIAIGDGTYKQFGYSIDTTVYFDVEQDPVVVYGASWKDCAGKARASNTAAVRDVLDTTFSPDPAANKSAQEERLQALTADRHKLLGDCADKAAAAASRWNASKASFSFGDGRITRQGSGERYGLGRRFTLNAMVGVGAAGAVNVTVQRVRNALDTASPASTPSRKSSTLAALRYTYAGTSEASRTRALVEASNARSSQDSALKGVFMVAAGIDYRVMDSRTFPLWLSLRVGRNRSVESGKDQTTALFTLNFQRATSLPDLPAS